MRSRVPIIAVVASLLWTRCGIAQTPADYQHLSREGKEYRVKLYVDVATEGLNRFGPSKNEAPQAYLLLRQGAERTIGVVYPSESLADLRNKLSDDDRHLATGELRKMISEGEAKQTLIRSLPNFGGKDVASETERVLNLNIFVTAAYRKELRLLKKPPYDFDESKFPGTRNELEDKYPGLKDSVYEVVSPTTNCNCLGYVLGQPNEFIQPVWEKPLSILPSQIVPDEIKTIKDPYGVLDQRFGNAGYDDKLPVDQVDLNDLPSGAIVAYEGYLYQGLQSVVPYIPDLLALIEGVYGENPLVPLHVAIINENGVFESVLGPRAPHILHEDASAIAGDKLGHPKYVYFPKK